MPKRLKKKAAKDENQATFASIERIIQIAEPETAQSFEAQFKAHMAKLGQKGGKVSGARRMENLTPEKRREIASKAARALWAKRKTAKER